MAIEAIFLRLTSRFELLVDALQSLALTVIEDRPPHGAVLLVERLGDLVDDLRGCTAEGLAASNQAGAAAGQPPDLYRLRRALAAANAHFMRVKYRFFDAAVAGDTLHELQSFGREQAGEWLGWSIGTIQALNACRDPIQALDEALLCAWDELAERAASRSVLLHNTNIGQQVLPAGDVQAGAPARRHSLEACDRMTS